MAECEGTDPIDDLLLAGRGGDLRRHAGGPLGESDGGLTSHVGGCIGAALDAEVVECPTDGAAEVFRRIAADLHEVDDGVVVLRRREEPGVERGSFGRRAIEGRHPTRTARSTGHRPATRAPRTGPGRGAGAPRSTS